MFDQLEFWHHQWHFSWCSHHLDSCATRIMIWMGNIVYYTVCAFHVLFYACTYSWSQVAVRDIEDTLSSMAVVVDKVELEETYQKVWDNSAGTLKASHPVRIKVRSWLLVNLYVKVGYWVRGIQLILIDYSNSTWCTSHIHCWQKWVTKHQL